MTIFCWKNGLSCCFLVIFSPSIYMHWMLESEQTEFLMRNILSRNYWDTHAFQMPNYQGHKTGVYWVHPHFLLVLCAYVWALTWFCLERISKPMKIKRGNRSPNPRRVRWGPPRATARTVESHRVQESKNGGSRAWGRCSYGTRLLEDCGHLTNLQTNQLSSNPARNERKPDQLS